MVFLNLLYYANAHDLSTSYSFCFVVLSDRASVFRDIRVLRKGEDVDETGTALNK